MSKEKYSEAALKCGEWMLANQKVCHTDANNGRFLAEIAVESKDINEWSTNWTTGMTVISLLALRRINKDEKYDTSIEAACSYLSSIQSLSKDSDDINGLFREVTPQTNWCHPRDALSAGWGLLRAGIELEREEWCDRAILFGEWFIDNCIKDNYPAWTFSVDGSTPHDWMLGSFHGGSPLFFFDLYEKTGDKKWLDKAAYPILDTYLKNHMDENGEIEVVVDPETGKSPMHEEKWQKVAAWAHMHKYNDDFTTLALLRAYEVGKDEKYLEAARKYLNWILERQLPNGGFANPEVPSACSSLILELLDMARIDGDSKWSDAAEKAGTRLLTLQETTDQSELVNGGFYGMIGLNGSDINHSLHLRSSSYALAALVKLTGTNIQPLYSA